MSDLDHTSFCGLYCLDCIPSHSEVFDLAAGLAGELDELQFDRYAPVIARRLPALEDYKTFRRTLTAIVGIRCPSACRGGGGRKNCAIRACAIRKRFLGCWECSAFESCPLLDTLTAGHGTTVRDNLRIIRKHGPEQWAGQRGPHYAWKQPPPGKAPADK